MTHIEHTEEKSAIYAYRKQATYMDYPGMGSIILFTPGCNMKCMFCHNPTLFDESDTYTIEKYTNILKSIKKQWIKAITITGGEPTLHKTLPNTIALAKAMKFSVKLDTNGTNPCMLESIIHSVDYIAMDIKCSQKSYEMLTGYSKTENILKSIELIKKKAKDYEFRTTVIEDFHSEHEIEECARLAGDCKRYILQPFVPHENLPSKELSNANRTRHSFLENAVITARKECANAFARNEDLLLK